MNFQGEFHRAAARVDNRIVAPTIDEFAHRAHLAWKPMEVVHGYDPLRLEVVYQEIEVFEIDGVMLTGKGEKQVAVTNKGS